MRLPAIALQPNSKFEPSVTLLVAAYNEADILKDKILNCLALDYPMEKLEIIFVTDGSDDNSASVINQFPKIKLLHNLERKGKLAAVNRAMSYVTSPFVVFCDANTALNTACIRQIIKHYQDEKIGAVAGEKKILTRETDGGSAGAGEGLYWKYESYLKKINYTLDYTPLGAPFPGVITSTFGHRENPFSGEGIETHKGLDIRGPMGAPVRAMANGVVIFAGPRGGFGNCIMIKHANGFETLYGHLSKIKIVNGQQIRIGDQIGNIGSTGRSTGPHLHYEVHKDGQRINPQSFLNFN